MIIYKELYLCIYQKYNDLKLQLVYKENDNNINQFENYVYYNIFD